MDGNARYSAARALLRDLDDEVAFRANPLVAAYADERHDRLRARVLRAVESLDPGLAATTPFERRFRLYQILLRCDLNGESHKEVAGALGISRRQFYLDRREAFLMVAEALERTPPEPQVDSVSCDALSMHLDYVQTLCEHGRYDAVWREALRVLREMRSHPREVEVWNIAAEAARFLGNVRQALEAVEQMTGVAASSMHEDRRRASALRIAISEIGLEWMQGNIDIALARFDRAAYESGNERTMYGRDATLFAILLGYGAELRIERGEWHRAEALIRRAERIIDRSELPYATARQQRLRARIAHETNGDSSRSALELHDALRQLQQHKQLPAIARGAVEYGIALAANERAEGLKYIDYGLVMAKDVCGYDQSAVLFAKSAPFVMERFGADEALRRIEEVRGRFPLSKHADLLVDIAEADARLARGEYEAAAEAGIHAGSSLEQAALFPAAAKARIITVDALARAGWVAKAKQLLKKSNEFVAAYADHATRRRAQGTALFLHSYAQ